MFVMSKSANSYKQIASGPNAGTSFATLQELKRQASLATKPLEPTIVEPSASTNSPPAAPRMTAAELDTTISQLEQDLIHNEGTFCSFKFKPDNSLNASHMC